MTEIEKRYLKAKRALFDRYYSDLNDKQRESVYTVNGPLLILAGAGSGKTTVLVRRIVHIIKYGNAYYDNRVPADVAEDRVKKLESAVELTKPELENILPEFAADQCPPWRMLAITFTNKAADEIRERLTSALDETYADEIWAGTFHKICMRILRSNYEAAGLKSGFSIYDDDDTKKAVIAVMKELEIDDKMIPVKYCMNQISRAKEKLMTPEQYEIENEMNHKAGQVAKVYRAYQERLVASNVLDFDDIIMKTVELLRNRPDICEKYASRFCYVSVDEYQDTNTAQFILVALLSKTYRNLMVVGDDDQSIYRFRGATVENILGFDKQYEDAKIVKLEQNYRSTQTILDAANSVISHNDTRHGKSLWTDNGIGESIHIRKLSDHDAEARFITTTVNESVAKSNGAKKYRDIAVLYRTNAQSRSIETVFTKSGIPYRVLGGTRFSDRKEIRDIVAYLQLINNHNDRERLMRIINEPRRKIGDRTLECVEIIAAEQNCSVFEVIEHADRYAVLSRSFGILLGFASLINGLTELSKTATLDVLVKETLERSGYKKMLIDGGKEEKDRLDNLDEFVSGVVEYMNRTEEPTLTGFLEENALVADVDRYDETADAVVLMTVHSAKGLEFPVVFIPGMENGIFPSEQDMYKTEDLEEERRLAYVAITRAKEAVYILHTKQRMMYGRTVFNPASMFLSEIPDRLKDETEEKPYYAQHNTVKTYYTDNSYGRSGADMTIKKSQSAQKPVQRTESLAVGDIVEHMSFGIGEIVSVKQMGSDILYEVVFERVGTKKLMATYARLKKIK